MYLHNHTPPRMEGDTQRSFACQADAHWVVRCWEAGWGHPDGWMWCFGQAPPKDFSNMCALTPDSALQEIGYSVSMGHRIRRYQVDSPRQPQMDIYSETKINALLFQAFAI